MLGGAEGKWDFGSLARDQTLTEKYVLVCFKTISEVIKSLKPGQKPNICKSTCMPLNE